MEKNPASLYTLKMKEFDENDRLQTRVLSIVVFIFILKGFKEKEQPEKKFATFTESHLFNKPNSAQVSQSYLFWAQ